MNEYKVSTANWTQLDFLINNFYEIVEFKRGRGIYGNRVILKREKTAEQIFNASGNFFDFYYMDANAVTELPRTVLEKIKVITKFVISPESMSILCNFKGDDMKNPLTWAIQTRKAFGAVSSLDYGALNNILINRYKLLDKDFLVRLIKHREKQYFLASSDAMNLISKDYANKQLALL